MPRTRKQKVGDARARELDPFMRAGMKGLNRSSWRPGDPVGRLVAPIVLEVILAVSREFRFASNRQEDS